MATPLMFEHFPKLVFDLFSAGCAEFMTASVPAKWRMKRGVDDTRPVLLFDYRPACALIMFSIWHFHCHFATTTLIREITGKVMSLLLSVMTGVIGKPEAETL